MPINYVLFFYFLYNLNICKVVKISDYGQIETHYFNIYNISTITSSIKHHYYFFSDNRITIY